ncbi:MAG: toprim domain-containing protein, partial [Oscillospiraceae bacterium]
MEKIKVNQVVVVEGKYDAIKLDSIIEGLIIPVNGFSIFKDEEKKLILKQLGTKNGIILVTDSDTAGFKIRNYLRNICKKANIIDVYIPNIEGKEPRKAEQSKEGFLGVEGVSKEILLKCFRDAGISATPETVAKKGN